MGGQDKRVDLREEYNEPLTQKSTPSEMKVVSRIQVLFEHELGQKTGWGKNEVKAMYRECVQKALMEALS